MKEFFDIEALGAETPRPEQAVVRIILQGVRLYIQGEGTADSGLFGRGQIVMNDSAELLRSVGLLVGTAFNISERAAADAIVCATRELEGWPGGVEDANSFVSARLVEGLVEAHQEEPASELFKLMTAVPGDQEDVFTYLLNRDSNVN